MSLSCSLNTSSRFSTVAVGLALGNAVYNRALAPYVAVKEEFPPHLTDEKTETQIDKGDGLELTAPQPAVPGKAKGLLPQEEEGQGHGAQTHPSTHLPPLPQPTTFSPPRFLPLQPQPGQLLLQGQSTYFLTSQADTRRPGSQELWVSKAP